MLLTYIGTNGATVTYSIDNADKTEHTAATGTGVTALKVGATYTVYGVTVTSRPNGGTVHWYEGGVYQASDSLPDDVLTPLGNLNDFDPAADTVARVTLVDTVTTNSDMRGTDNASTHSAADVWSVDTRSLTTFGTLVADVWAYATRTLSAFAFTPTPSNAADTTAIKAKTDNLPADTAAELAALLAAMPDADLVTFLGAYWKRKLDALDDRPVAGKRTYRLWNAAATAPEYTWVVDMTTGAREPMADAE